MNVSQYTNKYQTSSFYIGIIRAAVEEYVNRHGGSDLEVVATHISPNDFTAQGHAESGQAGAVVEVERIANRQVREAQERHSRQAALRERLESGEISEEEWEREYIFSF